ncbi:MAG TPA: tetratricopeptide repeat protein [Pyrinomonadaceae bacterium]|nr:tetratricopeptide repeat protein [Pyrinomonadaceae bacterium]
MPRSLSIIKLVLVVATGIAVTHLCGTAASGGRADGAAEVGARPPGPLPAGEPFSPSNARTADGKLIPAEQFFPASRCAGCHKDTHAAWAESLHRNAAREPFYRESADILLRQRGIEFTRHCESCHTPVALFSGALTKASPRQQAPFTELDDEGVTCAVCHSITEARLDGTGSYTIRRPTLLAREDGTPVYGEVSDAQILSDVPGHKRAVMRPLLRQPEFCATCHKVDAPAALNGYKNVRGFSAYDEWQQSGASRESVGSFYRSDQRMDCRSCHMPKVESADDRAAKQGVIASHRWLGANTAAPLFYGQVRQAEMVKEFLSSKVVGVDIFALRREATGERVMALAVGATNYAPLVPGEEVTAEVVVSNRKAAHSLPPEVRDLYELWVEFEVLDGEGRTVFSSGSLKPDGHLDESAHVYKTILLDQAGRTLTRHQIWTTTVKAYDNTIQAGRSDVARFRFRVPGGGAGPLTLRARFNYRRVIQEYADFVSKMRKRPVLNPVVRMAEAEVRVAPQEGAGAAPPAGSRVAAAARPDAEEQARQARRWNDYGIGLLEQAQFGPAAAAFRRASELKPRDQNLLVNVAIAELRTEQFGLAREQLRKAREALEAALAIDPADARTRFYWALLLRSEGKTREAADVLARVAAEFPRDREVQRQLAQTLYALGRFGEAIASFEAIASVDPTDAGAYQFLSPLYARLGRREEGARARSLFLRWRDDPLADTIAARFFSANPQWADERVWSHAHTAESAGRPTLTGYRAAPER